MTHLLAEHGILVIVVDVRVRVAQSVELLADQRLDLLFRHNPCTLEVVGLMHGQRHRLRRLRGTSWPRAERTSRALPRRSNHRPRRPLLALLMLLMLLLLALLHLLHLRLGPLARGGVLTYRHSDHLGLVLLPHLDVSQGDDLGRGALFAPAARWTGLLLRPRRLLRLHLPYHMVFVSAVFLFSSEYTE